MSYQGPNDRGESLFVQASLMDVDFTQKIYKFHFLLEPNGTLAGDNGVLRYGILTLNTMLMYIYSQDEIARI